MLRVGETGLLTVVIILLTVVIAATLQANGAFSSTAPCPVRHISADTIKPDISAHDAAIIAIALSWRNTCWNNQPEAVRQILLENTAEGPPL